MDGNRATVWSDAHSCIRMGMNVFHKGTIVGVHRGVFADVTVLMVPGCTHVRWLVWGNASTRMNGRKWLPIIHFGRRRHLRKTVIENTEVDVDSGLPAKHVQVYTHALSIFIRLMLFLACNTLNCSLSLSFNHYENSR